MIIIYKATNKKTKKIYIGQTKRTLKERNRQRKYSKSSFDLAFQKYGEDGFEWSIIENCKTQEDANLKEEFWISFFNSTQRGVGYNIKKGGNNHSHDAETKRKIGIAQIGEKNHSFGKTSKLAKSIIILETKKKYKGSGEIIKEFGWEEKDASQILSVCRGKRDTHKELHFRFLNDTGEPIKTKFDESEYLEKKENEKFAYYINEKKKMTREEIREIFSLTRKQLEDKIFEFKKNLEKNYIREKEKFNLFCDVKTFSKYEEKEKTLIIKKSNSNEKKVKCITDGKTFDSAAAAARYYAANGEKISTTTLNYYLLGKTLKPKFKLEFEYIKNS